nr:hypothetical protein GCM10020092_103560 [Actinoplanes digitatis]
MHTKWIAAATVAATALLQLPAGSPALAATVCNRYCDGRDPALSPGDRVATSAILYGRTFKVHVNDADAMIWATVENGQPGDEVWLDRSFDGGRTWQGDSRIGFTVVPARRWRLAHRHVQRRRLGRPRRRRAARLRQGRRPPRAHLHRLGAEHLERLGPAHGRGDRADDALRPGHRAVRHQRLVDRRQRAHRADRQQPDQRHAQLRLRDRRDVRQADQRRAGGSSATSTSTTPAGGGWPGWPRTTGPATAAT